MDGRWQYWRGLVGTFGLGALPTFLRAKWSRAPLEVRAPIPPPGASVGLRAHTSDLDTYTNVFIREEFAFPCRAPVRTIVDVGANIGMSALFFANRFPEARILALEPEPSNFALLARNVSQCSRILPIHAALAAEDGTLEVVDPGLGKWGFRTWADEAAGAAAPAQRTVISVPAFSLDTLCQRHALESIDILKLDIEGAEKEVLEASATWIAKVGIMLAELHDHFRPGCNRAFYRATSDFYCEWVQGELKCAARRARVPEDFGARISSR
jgi:FkbM family methyltransferase